MIYDDFVKAINELNGKKKKKKSEVKNNPYNPFYDLYNPSGAEFEYNDGVVFMLPYKKIEQATKEYGLLNADYVFAICNSDPFFVKNKKVFTCCHGTKEPDFELIANSFEEFLKIIAREAR